MRRSPAAILIALHRKSARAPGVSFRAIGSSPDASVVMRSPCRKITMKATSALEVPRTARSSARSVATS